MIQQVAFEVPAKIALGLASGELVQYGGVVRNAAGRIIKHLKPAGQDANKALELAANVINFAKQNKIVAIVALIVAGLAFIVGGAYHIVCKKKEEEKKAEQKALFDQFSNALSEYVQSLSEGTLTIDTIDKLQRAVDDLMAKGGSGEFTIEIEGEQFKELMRSVLDYTSRFAKANNFKTTPTILQFFNKTPTDLNSLKACLETQREILSQAA